MANITINPAVPATVGSGASSDTTAQGEQKTIIVDGTFTGTVRVEGTAVAGGATGFVSVASFTAPGQQKVSASLTAVRVTRAGEVSGTPDVTVIADDSGSLQANLPIVGTPVATDLLSDFKSIIASGDISGVLNVEVSQDNTDWIPLASFQTPGIKSFEVAAPFMRVVHVNNVLASTPVVDVSSPKQNAPTRYIVDAALRTVPGAVLEQNQIARFDTTAGNILRPLPAANSFPSGGCVTIKNEVGANSVAAQRDGADTIDSVAANPNIAAGVAAKFVSDGVSNWTVI